MVNPQSFYHVMNQLQVSHLCHLLKPLSLLGCPLLSLLSHCSLPVSTALFASSPLRAKHWTSFPFYIKSLPWWFQSPVLNNVDMMMIPIFIRISYISQWEQIFCDLIQQRLLTHSMCPSWKDRGVGWKILVPITQGPRLFECPCCSCTTWDMCPPWLPHGREGKCWRLTH